MNIISKSDIKWLKSLVSKGSNDQNFKIPEKTLIS